MNYFGFHYRNGFYFRRLEDGSVQITKTCSFLSKFPDYDGDNPTQDEVADWSLTIDPSSWASIVASVSARGETSQTYQDALAYHAKQGVCPNCGGSGTTSTPYTHPTNPNLDGWHSQVCTTCKGQG